nr:SPOR domain-containing protein [Rheinheimera maricola]
MGTAILVTAGIIFLPDLLDGEKQVVKDDFKVIPNRPEFQGVQQQQVFAQQPFVDAAAESTTAPVDEQPLDEQPLADTDLRGELPSQEFTQVTVEPVAQPDAAVTNPALAEAGWVVRVGSFSKVQNANALVTKLRQAGFVTFTRNIVNSQGVKLTSVLVGPELRKEKLEQQLAKLQQLTGIERLSVMSYQPTENN